MMVVQSPLDNGLRFRATIRHLRGVPPEFLFPKHAPARIIMLQYLAELAVLLHFLFLVS